MVFNMAYKDEFYIFKYVAKHLLQFNFRTL
jgi:hypothetical protein